MIFYITVLKALAAMIITNAHYGGVYPSDIFANGGLLGDVIFFAVSGFCLVNIKHTFAKWYRKRIIRIFPIVWIITSVYLLFGLYTFDDGSALEFYLYPTAYHFVASIILLYIGFYFVMKINLLRENIPKLMVGMFALQIIVYFLAYDTSYYHIDAVKEPMVRFLFFQSMLLGAYFRINNLKFLNKNSLVNWGALIVLIGAYFLSKLAFVKFSFLSPYQILNQIILFAVLYFVFRAFAGIDSKLEKMPIKLKGAFDFIALITLEIYVVQYVIIPKLAPLVFPLNWIAITALILLAAYTLNKISAVVIRKIENGFHLLDSAYDRKFVKKGTSI
ncbi:acyltransferase [Rossellomorea vietnamensis]|uniref:Acyltransferase n=1 Tax=Rossellomorea vietnamensis TaxID=218284 RepID=A0A5D4M2N2_9BACI|nr:acyltransferase family protein [Rossellomorea vietnamensis]TYR95906.1 acyltransferase [Rossellomorea vietnamensis]